MSNFWANPTMEPKRSFLFRLEIGNISPWLVLSTDRPSFEIGTVTANYLNVEFNYPGRVKWKPITCTIRETGDTNTVLTLKEILRKSGYQLMDEGVGVSGEDFKISVSRTKAISALAGTSVNESGGGSGKGVKITQVDSDGKPIDTWTLENAWISNCEFSNLSYDDEKINEFKLTITYDYATVDATNIAPKP
jgi:hypothetical protein